MTSSKTIVRDFLYLNFFSQAPIFIFGCFLFSRIDKPSELYKASPILLAWLIFAFFLQKYFSLGEKQFLFLFVIFIIGLIVYFSVYWDLSFRPIEKIGQNSYAMYLTHSLVIYGMSILAGKCGIEKSGILVFLIVFVISVITCYFLALILHVVIERKAHDLAESLVRWHEGKRD